MHQPIEVVPRSIARRYVNFGNTTIPHVLFTRPLDSYYNENSLFRICALGANKPKNAPNAEPPCAALLLFLITPDSNRKSWKM